MISEVLLFVLFSSIRLVRAQECPTGYSFHTGAVAQNQTVTWVPCPTEVTETLECGTLDVPLDWTDESAGVMTLSLVRIPANDTFSNGLSIVMNPGGPGESGVQQLVGDGTTMLDGAGGTYHIVSFDPRGVGLTIPYQCPQLCTEPSTGISLDDPAMMNATFVSLEEQGAYCAEQKPYDDLGELVGTAFTARDVKAVSEALNADGLIRYWGFSYGTLLGSTIAAMFPDQIERMVLDGNINPTDYYHGLNAESVDDVDAALAKFFESCAAAGPDYCALAQAGTTGEELLDNFNTFLNNLKTGTSTTISSSGETVGYDAVASLVFSSLKGPSEWPDVAGNLSVFYATERPATKLLKREFDPLLSFQVSTPQALIAITCGDWDSINGTLADFEAWLDLYEEHSKFGADQMIGILLSCATWPTKAKERFAGSFEGVRTQHPILFVNGPFDPVTPLISAQNSSSGFVGSVLLEHRGAGHCSLADPSTCTDNLVRNYWQTGELPAPGTVCTPDRAPFSYEPIAPSKRVMRRYDHSFEYPEHLVGEKRELHQVMPRQEPNICATVAPLEVAPIPATCTVGTATATATGTTTASTAPSSTATNAAAAVGGVEYPALGFILFLVVAITGFI